MPPKKKKPEKVEKAETSEPDEPENSGSDSEEPVSKPVKKSAFAMMMDSDDEDEDPEEEEKSSPSPKKSDKTDSGKKKKEEVREEVAMFGEKKKKKKKEAVDEEAKDVKKEDGKKEKKEKKDKKEGKEKKKRSPTVCEVTEVSAIPKKDKLKLCKVVVQPGVDPVDIVTSAPNIIAGHKFIAAPPGYTTANGIEVKVSPVGGVESCGMFCGPKEMGWDTDILDGNLAIMLGDSAEVGVPAPTYEDAVAAFQQREKEAKQKEEEAKAAASASAKDDKKGKKKKGKAAKEDDDDLDELLAEFKEAPAPAAPAAPAAPEVEEGTQETAKSASQKKKDKKKGKGDKGPAEDDFDAALEEFKPEDAAKPDGQDEGQEGEKGENEGLDAKTLANRKKKEKKKNKQQEKTGGEGMWATTTEAEKVEKAPETQEPAASSSKDEAPAAAKNQKGGKKESAIVKAARERLEMEQKLAEEKRAFEEAERKRIEEEQRQIEEEERKREEERQRKRDNKAAKIAKQKAEGTYQTKKQKEQAKRAAQLREQFGYSMAKDEDEEGDEETEKPQRRPLPAKKKKRPQRMQETQETVEETEKPEDEPEAREPEPQKIEQPEETKQEEDDDDDWEKKLEEEQSEPAVEKAEESDDDKGSDSGSDSSSDSDSSSSSSLTPLRSPVICIMGHVDTGKTKLLDKIRRTNVQDGEAGGITQQIGATFFPDIALQEQTQKVDEDFDLEVPGVLIIDTPGHESFNNLRMRGSSLADLAILVIDIMHGLEPQTVESLELLKKRRCPFIIALNKIDILYNWKSESYTSVREALDRQEESVVAEFQKRYKNVVLQLNERGLNCNLYWENEDFKSSVSIIPTSAITGEGVPDLLYMILKLTQDLMSDKLEVKEDLECTVIEVKNIEGLGTTIDVVLLNGTLKEGDTIVLAGLGGPIVTTIRALLTPQPMKEMRVKSEYVHHTQISTSMGVKISAPGLEDAVAGTQLLVVGPEDDLEELKDEVSEGFESILNDFEKEPAGVYVKASTLGSLEALLSFLQDMKIPVFDVGIGEVHKKDVKKACIMKEKKHPEYALILAFDVKVNQEAQKQADTDGVTIFTADIIYHLQDKFTKYMEKFRESQKTETRKVAVFPVVLQIDKQHIFRKQDPIIVGCQVVGGQLRVGTPLCVPDKGNLAIGHVAGIEINKKSVPKARRGDTVCVKIEQTTAQNHIMFGRHFDHTSQIYSHISRTSIDTLKEHFKDEMIKEDWELVIGMKKVFEIQ